MYAVKYSRISKKFKNKEVLNDLHLEIPKGSIFFLLGLNGEGKTTLLKITLNLLYAQSGKILFNYDINKIGAVLDGMDVHCNLTGFQNLKYYSLLCGNYSKKKIEEIMTSVGLDFSNKRNVSKYSLGMKKRLLLAYSLIIVPDLIILDEPFNGLDPSGILEIKRLLISLKEKGVTIVLSSHLIRETEDIATHYGILNVGKISSIFSEKDLYEAVTCLMFDRKNEEDMEYYHKLIKLDIKLFVYVNGDIIKCFFESLHNRDDLDEFKNFIQCATLADYFLAVTGGRDYGG